MQATKAWLSSLSGSVCNVAANVDIEQSSMNVLLLDGMESASWSYARMYRLPEAEGYDSSRCLGCKSTLCLDMKSNPITASIDGGSTINYQDCAYDVNRQA